LIGWSPSDTRGPPTTALRPRHRRQPRSSHPPPASRRSPRVARCASLSGSNSKSYWALVRKHVQPALDSRWLRGSAPFAAGRSGPDRPPVRGCAARSVETREGSTTSRRRISCLAYPVNVGAVSEPKLGLRNATSLTRDRWTRCRADMVCSSTVARVSRSGVEISAQSRERVQDAAPRLSSRRARCAAPGPAPVARAAGEPCPPTRNRHVTAPVDLHRGRGAA